MYTCDDCFAKKDKKRYINQQHRRNYIRICLLSNFFFSFSCCVYRSLSVVLAVVDFYGCCFFFSSVFIVRFSIAANLQLSQSFPTNIFLLTREKKSGNVFLSNRLICYQFKYIDEFAQCHMIFYSQHQWLTGFRLWFQPWIPPSFRWTIELFYIVNNNEHATKSSIEC